MGTKPLIVTWAGHLTLLRVHSHTYVRELTPAFPITMNLSNNPMGRAFKHTHLFHL